MVKLGRRPRKYNPRVPHLSSLMGRKLGVSAVAIPPPPASVSYTKVFPEDHVYGMMKNDQLGNCTCVSIYHLRQIWTGNANPPVVIEPDANVVLTYTEACGYCPGVPETDRGGVVQDVLTHWMKKGVPILPTVGSFGNTFDKLLAFYEVDRRDLNDVKWTIAWCGAAYIGFEVPAYLMTTVNGKPPDVWDVAKPGDDTRIVGGHAVILPGYDDEGLEVISWGRKYRMTWAFFNRYIDEIYGTVNKSWLDTTGKTPLDMSVEELGEQMVALRES